MEKPTNGGTSLLMQIKRRKFWKLFDKGLLLWFGSGEYDDANEAISKLHQTGSFHEFLGEFEKLMNCLPSWPKSALMGAFIAGLKE